MRFALLGDHPDGVAFALAAVATGRHSVVGADATFPESVHLALGSPRREADAEAMLADPAVEAVIVAGRATSREQQLRRALQSERHVVAVHPACDRVEGAYEASMTRDDVKVVLFPLLPLAHHPGVAALAAGPRPTLVRLARHARGEAADNADIDGLPASLPVWDVLRALGGDVVEVHGFARAEGVEAGEPVLVSGRFEKGGVFEATLIPRQHRDSLLLTAYRGADVATLHYPQGPAGPAFLTREGEPAESYFPPADPWPGFVERFEAAVSANGGGTPWQEEVRALELDDAARRAVERRRSQLMEYQEVGEEVGFKGAMTLVGCSLVWVVLLLLVVAVWFPMVAYLILPLLLVFVGLQAFRYLIPPKEKTGGGPAGRGD